MGKPLSQKSRLVITILYLVFLWIISKILFGFEHLVPPLADDNWIWFWAASVSLVFAQFIDQPFYSAPNNALLNSIAGLLAVYGAFQGNTSSLTQANKFLWIAALIVFMITCLVAVLAMLLRDSGNKAFEFVARLATQVSRILGSPRVVSTFVFLVAVWSFHSISTRDTFWLFTIWGVIVLGQPLERYLPYLSKVIPYLASLREDRRLGMVISRREPNILNIKVTNGEPPKLNTLLWIVSSNGQTQLAVAIDKFWLVGERWTRAMILEGFENIARDKVSIGYGDEGTVFRCNAEVLADALREKLLKHDWFIKQQNLVGFVIEGSNVNTIVVELIRNDIDIEEGQLLDARVGDKEVLFQVIDGITASEILSQANRHGFTEVKARKLGTWGNNNDFLQPVPWLPQIYSPVYIREPVKATFSSAYIGYIPQTNYGLSVDCHSLVTHNTAILGVLGTGKTRLALELIGRMLASGISVCVIDITGRYKNDLYNLLDIEAHRIFEDEVDTIKDKEKFAYENKEYGGNQGEFRNIVQNHLEQLINSKMAQLRVFEPNEYRVTEQVTNIRNVNEAGNWKQKVGHGLLTPAQITRIITEEMLACVQNIGVSDVARVCLVFEEAHSLVPEWNVAASEGDSRVSNATAKAILQGRKYGLGCILITQRTAHITKSVLNQCHTIFALQTFDKTGMDFLSNYIGDDYTNILSTLKERHCVTYGKALNAGTPLIVELNVHEDSTQIATKFTSPEMVIENPPVQDIAVEDVDTTI